MKRHILTQRIAYDAWQAAGSPADGPGVLGGFNPALPKAALVALWAVERGAPLDHAEAAVEFFGKLATVEDPPVLVTETAFALDPECFAWCVTQRAVADAMASTRGATSYLEFYP